MAVSTRGPAGAGGDGHATEGRSGHATALVAGAVVLRRFAEVPAPCKETRAGGGIVGGARDVGCPPYDRPEMLLNSAQAAAAPRALAGALPWRTAWAPGTGSFSPRLTPAPCYVVLLRMQRPCSGRRAGCHLGSRPGPQSGVRLVRAGSRAREIEHLIARKEAPTTRPCHAPDYLSASSPTTPQPTPRHQRHQSAQEARGNAAEWRPARNRCWWAVTSVSSAAVRNSLECRGARDSASRA